MNLPKYIILKLAKISDKEKNFKAVREKRHSIQRGGGIQNYGRFLIRNSTRQKTMNQIFPLLKKNYPLRILKPMKISFKTEGKNKDFQTKSGRIYLYSKK